MSCKKWFWVCWLIRGIGVLLVVVAGFFVSFLPEWEIFNTVLAYFGLLVFITGCVIELVKARCPRCHRVVHYFNMMPFPNPPDHCRHCGERLDKLPL